MNSDYGRALSTRIALAATSDVSAPQNARVYLAIGVHASAVDILQVGFVVL